MPSPLAHTASLSQLDCPSACSVWAAPCLAPTGCIDCSATAASITVAILWQIYSMHKVLAITLFDSGLNIAQSVPPHPSASAKCVHQYLCWSPCNCSVWGLAQGLGTAAVSGYLQLLLRSHTCSMCDLLHTLPPKCLCHGVPLWPNSHSMV